METLIKRIATALAYGQTRQEIFDNFVGSVIEGKDLTASVEDVYLAYTGALLLEQDR